MVVDAESSVPLDFETTLEVGRWRAWGEEILDGDSEE